MVQAIFLVVAQASSVAEMFAQSRTALVARTASAIDSGAAQEALVVAMNAQPLAANVVNVLLMGTSTQ